MKLLIPFSKITILHRFIASKNILPSTELDDIFLPNPSIDSFEFNEKLAKGIALINKILGFTLHMALLDDTKAISIYLEAYEDTIFFRPYLHEIAIISDIDQYIKEINPQHIAYTEPSDSFSFHAFFPDFNKKTRLSLLCQSDDNPELFTEVTQKHQRCFQQQLSTLGRHPALPVGKQSIRDRGINSFKLHISIKNFPYLTSKLRNFILKQLTSLLNETAIKNPEINLMYKIINGYLTMNKERFKNSAQITIHFNDYSSLKAVILLTQKIEALLTKLPIDKPTELDPKDIISFNPFVSGRFGWLRLDSTYAVFHTSTLF